MANVGAFKNLGENDIVSTRTLLHEAIPLTGTIVSGTYSEENIKFHPHGMFQSVYDYPYLSSSANHIFDITAGTSTKSGNHSTSQNQYKKKKNIYNQMSQVLVGYDVTGSVLRFDADGNILAGGSKLDDVFILPFSRLLVKDEIKKETFSMIIGVSSSAAFGDGQVFRDRILISDIGAKTSYFVNSPAGEYGILYATASHQSKTNLLHGTGVTTIGSNIYHTVGLLYYQAGIAVISGSIFNDQADGGIINNSTGSCKFFDSTLIAAAGTSSLDEALSNHAIKDVGNNFRNRIYNISFNNTTELNSTIYFCRANHNEFNYSTNQTYLSGSKIIIKNDNPSADPISYITTIGLYSPNDELMGVAKLSEPLKKTPSQEFTLRVRLDY